MKKLFLTLSCFVAAVLVNAQTPTYVWAKSMGSTSSDHGKSIAVDASGNVYTTGHFRGTVDFDPDPSKQKTFNLKSAGDSDVFISKLNASGNFVWAKRLGGTTADVGQSIAVDASGNVYTTGYFTGTVDFDPDPDRKKVYNLTSSGQKDNFILKLNSSGNFVWAKRMGGISRYFGPRLALDANGNIYVTGPFTETSDFGSTTLTSAGGYDIFISKLSSSGVFQWAKKMGGEHDDAARAVALGGSGNIYISGYYSQTGTGSDLFISKLDANGDVVWFKQMGAGYGTIGTSLKVDAEGNVYTTGQLAGTVDFDPDETATFELTSAGQNDLFILKLDGNGDFEWAKSMGSTNPDGGSSLALDASGNIYTTGWFSGTVNFNSAGTANLISNGWLDVFLLKLDKNGNFIWALNFGGNYHDIGWGITLDASGNIYMTGGFGSTVDFDPGSGVVNLTAVYDFDIYVLKWSQPTSGEPFKEDITTGVQELRASADFLLFPNPAKEQVTISCNLVYAVIAEIKLIDITGRTIISELFTAKQGKNNYTLHLNGVSKGVYYIEFTTEGHERIVKKLMVE